MEKHSGLDRSVGKTIVVSIEWTIGLATLLSTIVLRCTPL